MIRARPSAPQRNVGLCGAEAARPCPSALLDVRQCMGSLATAWASGGKGQIGACTLIAGRGCGACKWAAWGSVRNAVLRC